VLWKKTSTDPATDKFMPPTFHRATRHALEPRNSRREEAQTWFRSRMSLLTSAATRFMEKAWVTASVRSVN
jgi:hypothetical protein